MPRSGRVRPCNPERRDEKHARNFGEAAERRALSRAHRLALRLRHAVRDGHRLDDHGASIMAAALAYCPDSRDGQHRTEPGERPLDAARCSCCGLGGLAANDPTVGR